uniref:Uncharacterized protein n=1 Tax=Setaria viridis TaxID=4556 RepID=A0A4U6WIW8_SETVI|nr:hypothetical protein SEVIR_1G372201v2 [Setaria viridis]
MVGLMFRSREEWLLGLVNCFFLEGNEGRTKRQPCFALLREKGARGRLVPRLLSVPIPPSDDFSPSPSAAGGRAALATPEPPLVVLLPRITLMPLPIILHWRGVGDPSPLASFLILF